MAARTKQAAPAPSPTTWLSPLDAAFLYFDRPEQRLHVGCVALLEGQIPFEEFVATVDTRMLGTMPRYRQRPRRPAFDLNAPRWEDEASFEVRRHVRHVAVPSPGDDRALQALVDDLFAARLDPAHPLWEMYFIDGLAGGRSALLCKMHHSMIDGVSGAQVLAALADPAVAPPAPLPPSPPLPTDQPRFGFAAVVDGLRDAGEALSLLSDLVWRPSPPTPFNGRLSDARRVVWASLALDEILTLRAAAGVTMNDVMLAIIAGAMRKALLERGATPPAGGLRVIAPVSTRLPEQRLDLGNLVAAMFPRLPVDVADPAERLRRIAADTRNLKARGQARAVGRALGLLGMLPTPLAALAGRLMDGSLTNTVCTNVPGPRGAQTLLGRRITEVHPIVPLFFGMGVEFAVLSYSDRVSISAVADPRLVPEISAFPGWLSHAVAELRAAVTVAAPSAPRMAAAGQPQVRDLMSQPVVTLPPDASLAAVATKMTTHRIRHVPVVEASGRLVGLITQRDLLSIQPSRLEVAADPRQLAALARIPVRDVMETHVAGVAPNDLASTAADQLRRHRIGCLPVLEAGGRLVGIITRSDFLSWATQNAPSAA